MGFQDKSNSVDIELLVGGEEAFKLIRELIINAKETIEINMFIWRDDKIGNLVAADLLKAADKGVHIIIRKDRKGGLFEFSEETRQSFFHKDDTRLLKIQGEILNYVYPMIGKAESQKQVANLLVDKICNHKNIKVERDNIRNDHSKYYIIDETELVMGGINIEDKEVYTDVESRKYHDYMVHIQGKSEVIKFRKYLSGKLKYSSKEYITYLLNNVKETPKRLEAKGHIISILKEAKKSVLIIMAYLGDNDISRQLVGLSNKGIEVRIIVPEKANLQQDYNMKVLKDIYLKSNKRIKIYKSQDMIHAKMLVIDNEIMTVGSLNLNRQAMAKLSELNIVIRLEGNGFKKKLIKSIDEQISISKEITSIDGFIYKSIKALFEGVI